MNVSPVDGGTVLVNGETPPAYPFISPYPKNSTVSLEAVPGAGHTFTGWTGDAAGNMNQVSVVMSCDRTVGANFSAGSRPAAAGDLVWDDRDGDGIQDSGEPGLDNIPVSLYDAGGVLVASNVTANGGLYRFGGLTPGGYRIKFALPQGYVFSPGGKGSDRALDSNADASGWTDNLTLGIGQEDVTVDAGLYYFDKVVDYAVPLQSGWNLISLPLIPQSSRIEDIFSGTGVQTVATFDGPTQSWRFYHSGGPSGIPNMVCGQGYWVMATAPCTLTIHGRVPPLPRSIPLVAGWDLVGLPFAGGSSRLQDIAAACNATGIFGFDTVTRGWHFYAPGAPSNLMELRNGQGYWMKVTGSSSLTLSQIAENVTPAQAQAMITQNSANPDFVVLDLRTPSEYASGHIAGALDLDYYSDGFLAGVNGLDKSQTYLIYCKSGFRSGIAMEIMEAVGFREIYHMPAGILGWQAAGLPVVN